MTAMTEPIGFDDTAAGQALSRLPHQYLADKITSERERIDRQLRTRERWMAILTPARFQRIRSNGSSARRPRLKRVAEVLGLAGHLPVSELHDAHRVRRPCIVGDDEFSDPEVGSAEFRPYW